MLFTKDEVDLLLTALDDFEECPVIPPSVGMSRYNLKPYIASAREKMKTYCALTFFTKQELSVLAFAAYDSALALAYTSPRAAEACQDLFDRLSDLAEP